MVFTNKKEGSVNEILAAEIRNNESRRNEETTAKTPST